MASIAGTAEVDICNLALSAIGHTTFIEDLADDSEEAALCLVQYPQCRDEVLEAIAWPFNTRRSVPAALDETTLEQGEVPDEWTYAFALPSDCLPLGLRRISIGMRNLLPGQEPPFAVEYDGLLGRLVVFTDEETPEFVYSARVDNPALYSATFRRALGERLAIELIRGLRKDLKLVPGQWAAYRAALAVAVATVKRNQRPDADPVPEHLQAR